MFCTGSGIIFAGSSIILILVFEIVFQNGWPSKMDVNSINVFHIVLDEHTIVR